MVQDAHLAIYHRFFEPYPFVVSCSVLLSILEPHMQLPPDIDLCKCTSKPVEFETASAIPFSSVLSHGGPLPKSNCQDEPDGKLDVSDSAGKSDSFEDRNLLFAPPELQSTKLTNISDVANQNSSNQLGINLEQKHVKKDFNSHCPNFVLDAGFGAEYFNLQADYSQLVNYPDCELRASEFRRLALELHVQNNVTVESHDAAIDALLLAAECYVNPYFMLYFGASPKLMALLNTNEDRTSGSDHILDLKRTFGKTTTNLEAIAQLERKRDKIVLQILLEAAEMDREYYAKLSNVEVSPCSTERVDDQVIKMSPLDVEMQDAITLVRQNQALLCNFLVQRLHREQNSMHEFLMQSLIYVLHSATKLYCPSEPVIEIALKSAEEFNMMLVSLHLQMEDVSLSLTPERIHGLQRRWILLQRLIVATSNGDEEGDIGTNIHNKYRCGNLIPASAWMQKISHFSSSVYPLVRFVGWMAVSRNAKQYLKDHIFLASDLWQLTCLLSIFADDLAVVDNVVNRKYEEAIENSQCDISCSSKKGLENHEGQSFPVIYPELQKFFPDMKKQFQTFGEVILEAVGLQLRSVPFTLVADIISWFSELCSWPYSSHSPSGKTILKGYNAKNARAIILYILEAIIAEHMEAMVPEIPRVVQVLMSLSSVAYCDVLFLESVLRLLKPIISYSLSKVSHDEISLTNDSCHNFEELCFSVLFNKIKEKSENQHSSEYKGYNMAQSIFILASVFPDLSIHHKREFLRSLPNWVKFYAFEPTTSFYDYLSAFQCVVDSCKSLLLCLLRGFGAIPPQQTSPNMNGDELSDVDQVPIIGFLSEVFQTSHENDAAKVESVNENTLVDQFNLSSDDLEGISKDIEGIITELNIAMEKCWNFHHQLARKLTIASAECFFLLKCLISVAQNCYNDNDDDQSSSSKSADLVKLHWRSGLEGLIEMILLLQETSCWRVSSLMLDSLLEAPCSFYLDNVICLVCSAIKNASCSAPKICWRLQTDKWLSSLVARGICNTQDSELPLIDLFCTLLGHAEPEQRVIAIKHLGKLIGQCENGERSVVFLKSDFVPTKLIASLPDFVQSHLVSSTWDEIVVLASSESTLHIRLQAMMLLFDYIPFAERHQLQSFLMAADDICCLQNLQQVPDGPILHLSLALIAYACLYSPAEDISLIPQNVWRNVEALGSRNQGTKSSLSLPNGEYKSSQ